VLFEAGARPQLQLVRSVDELAALEPEWLELWRRDPRATPFQSPMWLIPWARRFTSGELACAAVRNDERLVSLLPAFTWHNPKLEQRELVLLGTGVSDYTDGLFDPACAGQALRVALDGLANQADWELLNFEELRADSPLASLPLERKCQSVCPVLALPAHGTTLRSVVPASLWRNLRMYRHRAERTGRLEFEAATRATLEECLDQLFALHAARWREKNVPSLLRDAKVRAFDAEAARRMLTADVLRLFRVRCAGRTIAVLYGFSSHGRFFSYLTGFDPNFASLSPGTLILGHALEEAMRERCTMFDFLRGPERYKYLWGAKDMQTFRLRGCRRFAVGGTMKDDQYQKSVGTAEQSGAFSAGGKPSAR
jgi:CelD/BcsL family acetyltransferase involved in cellulose biosynthesis